MSNRVKCADCGLLATYNEGSRDIYGIDKYGRESGNLPQNWCKTPLCCAGVPIGKEMKGIEQQEFLRVINRERECDKFFRWRIGFQPKEHLEMMFQDELRQMATDQRERDRTWQDDVRKRDETDRDKRRTEDLARQSKERRIDKVWNIGLVVFAAFIGFFLWLVQLVITLLIK
jgi:hypothetical protein